MFGFNIHDPEVHDALQHLLETSRRNGRRESDRLDVIDVRIASVGLTLQKLWEILSMIHPDVQKLLDQADEVKTVMSAYHDRMAAADAKAAELEAKVAAVEAVDPENLAAIQKAGADLHEAIAAAKVVLAAVAEAPAAAPVSEDPAPAADAPAAPPVEPDPALQDPGATS